MQRTFVVDRVQFAIEGSSFSFSPTRSTRIYQAGLGIGFALLSLIAAVYAFRNGYLADLIDAPDRFRQRAFCGMVCFAVIMLGGVYAYWRKSTETYVFDVARGVFVHGNKLAASLATATGVCVRRSRANSETHPTWTVCWMEDKQVRRIPLLTFNLAEDAHRVATSVADHLKLPIVSQP